MFTSPFHSQQLANPQQDQHLLTCDRSENIHAGHGMRKDKSKEPLKKSKLWAR